MKTILVSGASGIVGYGILKSLRSTNKELRLIGSSIYDDTVAPAFCDIFEKAIPTTNIDYIDWLLTVIKKYEISLIIPGIEADLYSWTENIDIIKQSGAIVLTNRISLVNLCKDKWEFFQELSKVNNKYLIPTSVESNFNLIVSMYGLPFLLKPKRGFASKGIVKITNEIEFNAYKDKISKTLIVQQIVGNEDEEYTTSAFCDGNGSFYTIMTLKRKLANDGFTDRAETSESNEIVEAIGHFCKILKPLGPTNFQFRRHNGDLKLLEINPRISSSTSIRMAFGYNEAEMVVEYYLDNKIPIQPNLKTGKAIRYTEDKIFFDDSCNI
jgi:carbamoyl-phosphate synthase large subunit